MWAGKEEGAYMARRRASKPRIVAIDPIYNNVLVTKLINRSMRDGKKSVAQKQIYKAFAIIAEKSEEEPVTVFLRALENIKPTMEVRSRRVGGAAYQVPQPVRGVRKDSLALRWLIEVANNRSNSEFHTYGEKLAAEILEAAKGEGGAVKKRTDMEKIAESNKAFSHFRW